MRFHSLARWGILVPALAFLAIGCSDGSDPLSTSTDGVGGNNSIDNIDLNQEYGGLAFTDEQPAFGDDLLAAESLEMENSLMLEDDEAVVLDQAPELRDHPRLRRTVVRILWGQLDGRPEGVDPSRVLNDERPDLPVVDWSGGLHVSEGAVALKRTILFEPRTDHMLPRPDRQTLRWTSLTRPHIDGILVCILQRPDSNGVYADGELQFRTEAFSATIAFSDLDGLDRTATIDDFGNAISFEGRVLDEYCPSGMMRGYWVKLPGHDGGFYRGHWVDDMGSPVGHVLGRWGVNEQGEHVFAGKIIGRNGECRGLMQGQWEATEDGGGVFYGHWAGKFGRIEGELRGEYRSSEYAGLGFFRAGWRASCPDVADRGDQTP
jgi:hypothetical protein